MAGIVIYRSKVIPSGFIHGFPERSGGVSQGLRSSLNLGFRWGDDKDHVEENRRLLAKQVGYDPTWLQVTKHVHGTNVWKVGDSLPEPPEFDGLVCDRGQAVLGAFAADCMPIVFADPDANICGACHAGWRGTVDGVAAKVVAAMGSLGSKAKSLRVAIGPSIGPCCFEVGPEVVDQFRSRWPDVDGLVVAGPAKDHINLRAAVVAELLALGVERENIDADPPCTKCNPDRFFSYRRDGLQGGVHMGFIGIG